MRIKGERARRARTLGVETPLRILYLLPPPSREPAVSVLLSVLLLVAVAPLSSADTPASPAAPAVSPAPGYGSAHFVATGSPQCRAHVLAGVLALHSFMYDDARDDFIAAERAAPCPIAFWGEAMTYDHPLWHGEDLAQGRAALSRIPAAAPVSAAERGLIGAARALYAQDGWQARHEAWREALDRLHRELPQDDEVALFDALALYAGSDTGKDVRRAMQAAAIALDVFERNPDHPGAAHYLIHACDSPDHAILALKAARRYAQIAPAASHALHMPAHIFVQLGMWQDAEASNAAAFAASRAWAARKHLPEAREDWHSFTWLAAARLEQGKVEAVREMLRALTPAAHAGDAELRSAYANLVSLLLSSTSAWAETEALLAPLTPAGKDDRAAQRTAARVRLASAAARGDVAQAGQLADLVEKLSQAGGGHEPAPDVPLEVAAAVAQARSVAEPRTLGEAIEKTRALADAEDAEPVSGPALATPAREQLGDLLLRMHRYAEAEAAFRKALEQRPNRAHALSGLMFAARGADDPQAASEAQRQLTAQLRAADATPRP